MSVNIVKISKFQKYFQICCELKHLFVYRKVANHQETFCSIWADSNYYGLRSFGLQRWNRFAIVKKVHTRALQQ